MDSAQLLRSARSRAGLSQAELARRAGVTQPVISAYENGSREPALSTLTKLVEATGHELVIEARPTDRLRPGLPDTTMGRRLRRCRRQIIDVLSAQGVTAPTVFGSVARGDNAETSDLDLAVTAPPGLSVFDLVGLRRRLSELLGVDVDVVPFDSLRREVREQIDREGIPL